MCNSLFGGNSCTWVLILVIIFLLSQCDRGTYSNDGDCDRSNYNTRSCC